MDCFKSLYLDYIRHISVADLGGFLGQDFKPSEMLVEDTLKLKILEGSTTPRFLS